MISSQGLTDRVSANLTNGEAGVGPTFTDKSTETQQRHLIF